NFSTWIKHAEMVFSTTQVSHTSRHTFLCNAAGNEILQYGYFIVKGISGLIFYKNSRFVYGVFDLFCS
ncbi:MAG: hypothetical protein ACK41Q_06095, partial [Candidatus Brocadia sp.]